MLPRSAANWRPLLDAALQRRAALLADPHSSVARLFDGGQDGIDGLVVDKLGDVLIAQLYVGRLALDELTARALCEAIAHRVAARAVYRKVYPRDRSTRAAELDRLHRDPNPWIGSPTEPELAVREAGLTFLVRPYDGYATGLYLDHRAGRGTVRALASGRRVLNLFAYTCGFTVAAAHGGAAETASVDVSKKALEWGKRNLMANGLPLAPHRFICSDVFDYYLRACRQGRRFDFAILDPPTFARVPHARRTFSLTRDLFRLVAGVVEILDPGGVLYITANRLGTTRLQLESVATRAAAAAGRRCETISRPPGDLSGAPGPSEGNSAVFRVS